MSLLVTATQQTPQTLFSFGIKFAAALLDIRSARDPSAFGTRDTQMDEGCAAGGRLTRPQVLGRRVLPLIIAICVGCCLIFGTAPVTANPVRRDPPASGWQGAGVLSRERRSGVAVDDVTGTKLSDSQSASSDLEEEVHRLSRRALVYNSVAKRSLPYFISTPRTARQGLDIGSANGQFAFIWSDGHPRIAQWDSSRGVVKNRWFLLRKPLLKVGCRNFDTKWSTVGEITVNCGSKLVLSVNVSSATQSGQVKARLVTIDNLGNVRFYGPQKASGSSLLLTLTPSFNNYTGSPAANLKVWRPVSPNIKAKTTKASPEKTKTTKARVPVR